MIILDTQASEEQKLKIKIAQLERKLQDLQVRNQELERLASTDPLTQIPNRGAFDSDLQGEWNRCRRHEQPLCILLIDIDHFKRFNDTYGHQAGDRLLKRLVRAWAGVPCRSGDRVYRYGGEEFAVLLPDTHLFGAKHVARDILTTTKRFGVTCSIGVAVCVPIEGVQPDSLIAVADNRLYSAKAKGRDRVCLGQGIWALDGGSSSEMVTR